MIKNNETLAAILAEARDKYTVHDCNECDFRKSCERSFGGDECKSTRQSIFLAFGIEDGYFTKLLDRIEAAAKRERAIADAMFAVKDKPLPHPDPENAPLMYPPMTKTQFQTLSDLVAIAHDEMDGLPHHEQELERFDSLLSDMKARYAFDKPCAAPSSAAAMREALEKARSNIAACRMFPAWKSRKDDLLMEAYKSINAALAAPARNCDVSRDTKETIERCLASLNVESSSASFDAGVCAAIGWLFAEAKGGAE